MTTNETNIREIRYHSSHSKALGAAGGAAGGGAAATGGAGGAFKFTAARKGESRHHPAHLLAFTLRARNFSGGVKNQFFKLMITLSAMIFIDWHFTTLL